MILFSRITLLIAIFFTSISSAEELNTDKMESVLEQTQKLSKKHGAENVLVVFDIDNTLLANRGNFGSDQWFTWQQSLLFKDSKNPALIAKDFNELIEAFGIILTFNSQRTSDPKSASVIKKIQNIGKEGKRVKTMSLTSRGYQYHFATLRELKRNGIDFACCDPEVEKKISPGVWDSHDPKKSGKGYGFKKSEIQSFKFDKRPRKLMYSNGVFFTSGMHKGAMLKVFFHKLGKSPKAIIFVDDKEKHTKSVQSAFKGSGLEVVTFRFSREDALVEKFHKGSKDKVVSQWREFQQAFDSIEPDVIDQKIQKVLSN